MLWLLVDHCGDVSAYLIHSLLKKRIQNKIAMLNLFGRKINVLAVMMVFLLIAFIIPGNVAVQGHDTKIEREEEE
jgi:hypothetical protein